MTPGLTTWRSHPVRTRAITVARMAPAHGRMTLVMTFASELDAEPLAPEAHRRRGEEFRIVELIVERAVRLARAGPEDLRVVAVELLPEREVPAREGERRAARPHPPDERRRKREHDRDLAQPQEVARLDVVLLDLRRRDRLTARLADVRPVAPEPLDVGVAALVGRQDRLGRVLEEAVAVLLPQAVEPVAGLAVELRVDTDRADVERRVDAGLELRELVAQVLRRVGDDDPAVLHVDRADPVGPPRDRRPAPDGSAGRAEERRV